LGDDTGGWTNRIWEKRLRFTLFYRCLHLPTVNIMTVEDPVEYNIDGVQQAQVNPKKNVTFSAGLRAIVRQDPDIIMVGEIRDKETAVNFYTCRLNWTFSSFHFAYK